MPLPGGPSGTAGNRYEARWTVACMARVLNGENVGARTRSGKIVSEAEKRRLIAKCSDPEVKALFVAG